MTWPVNFPAPIDYPNLTIHNVGAQPLYLGGENVSVSSGLVVGAGMTVVVPLSPTLTGAALSIATEGSMVKPKPLIAERIKATKDAVENLSNTHARGMALLALAEAELWVKEANK